jgi:glycosyltransferase involved in cell wall biosynthesis
MNPTGKVDVLIVGPVPHPRSYVGGIAVLLTTQLAHWDLPVSVGHFNTELWARRPGETGRFRLENLLAFLVNAVRLSWAILRRRPVVAHFHSSVELALLKDMALAWWVRYVWGRYVVLQVHNAVAGMILLPRPPFWRRAELGLLMASCDRVAFPAQSVIDDLARMLPPRRAARFRAKAVMLRNFTELAGPRPERQAPIAPVRVLFLGNVAREKGACDLVQAAEKTARRCTIPFAVVFAGPVESSEEESQISALVARLRLRDRVRFLGQVTGRARAQALGEADIFALPSYGEGVPVSLLEAMAHGIPVVVTRVGGIPETVADGVEGFLIRPGDVEALADALARLIETPLLRVRMGRAGQERVARHYAVGTYLASLRRLYSCVGLPQLAET